MTASDGTGVAIPPGALPTGTTITVTPDLNAPVPATTQAATVGTPVTFGPEGETFSVPVTVTLSFDPSKLPPGKDASSITILTAPAGTTSFTELATTVVDSTHVAALTPHFSTFVATVVEPDAGFPSADAGTGAPDAGGPGGNDAGQPGGGNDGGSMGSDGGASGGSDGGAAGTPDAGGPGSDGGIPGGGGDGGSSGGSDAGSGSPDAGGPGGGGGDGGSGGGADAGTGGGSDAGSGGSPDAGSGGGDAGSFTGTDDLTYLQDSQVRATVPVDLSAKTISVLVPADAGQFQTYSITGTDAGTFSIPGVASIGKYVTLNQVGFFWTAASSIDLSMYGLGRPNAVAPSVGTNLTIYGSPMVAWQPTDDVEVTSEGAGLGFSDIFYTSQVGVGMTSYPDAGDTVLDVGLDYHGMAVNFLGSGGNIEGSLGDVAYVTHLVSQPLTGSVTSAIALQEGYSTSAFNMVDGASPNLLSGTFTDAGTMTSVNLTAAVSNYESLRTSVNVNAQDVSAGASFYIDADPGGLSRGQPSGTPDLLIVNMTWSASTPNEQLAYTFLNPFPISWGLFGLLSDQFSVTYTQPGGTATQSVSGQVGIQDTLSSLQATSTLTPLVGPVAGATINGLTLASPQTGVGTTPIISWQPPTLGTPTAYSVSITAFASNFASTSSVAQLHTAATTTSLQVPPGILAVGTYYVFTIEAIYSPNSNALTPREATFPYAWADYLSALVTP